jgi:predicted nucleotidyltransferase
MNLPPWAAEALRELGVAAVWLFGSMVTGATHTHSDADVALLLTDEAPPPSLRERGRVSDLLARALGQPDIDLVVLDEAPLELRAAVIGQGRLLAQPDAPRRVRFEVETLSQWFDVREALRTQDRAYVARTARQGLA